MNKVGKIFWDKKMRYGSVELNGRTAHLFRPEVGWDEAQCKPRLGWGVHVCFPWNQSNRVEVKARTLPQLVKRLEAHPEDLRPYSPF